MDITIVRTTNELRAQVERYKQAGERVGFVPTMGALHEGHVSLVRLVKESCDRCVASVFINPKQFAAHEDLSAYPRDEAGDCAKLAQAGCDLVFAPSVEIMYPDDFATEISLTGVSSDLEGASRPHFFGGVATVVAKLFLQVAPHAAAFGEKDYQQLLVIKKLVRDLAFPIEIIAGPTVRERDGLAMSSRNAYLSPQERAAAAAFPAALQTACESLSRGAAIAPTLAQAEAAILQAGFALVDYIAVRDPVTLAPLPGAVLTRSARLLAAARIGRTRLLDNFPITPQAAPH